MKKIAIITGAVVVANTVANLGLVGVRSLNIATGGNIRAGLWFLTAPLVLTPAPFMLKHMVNEANAA